MPAADMTTPELITECHAAQSRGEEVAESVARCIAGYWHGGQGSAFYSFASSGHYDRSALLVELSEAIALSYSDLTAGEQLPLDMLGTYLINRQS